MKKTKFQKNQELKDTTKSNLIYRLIGDDLTWFGCENNGIDQQ